MQMPASAGEQGPGDSTSRSGASASLSVMLLTGCAPCRCRLPILGVCLGHQAIGAALGGRVVRAQRQMHGKTSVLAHDGQGVYGGLPERVTVIRYHSLAIERESLPAELDVTSTAEDGEIMGVRHRDLAGSATPMEGVQFHPESILSEHGHAMLKNFLAMSAGAGAERAQ